MTLSTKKKRKPGRPATGRGIMLSGRVPAELVAAVDRWAKANGISRSQAVRRLIEQALANKKR
jgi:Ribbon-helix-helix protein, copG family